MTRSTFIVLALLVAAPLSAQTPVPVAPASPAAPAQAGDAQLRLVVVDQTAAGIPTATVTLTPGVGQPITVMTDEHGVVTIQTLGVGAVKVHAEFVGFETYDGVVTLRRGTNTQTITMALAGVSQEVTVSTDGPIGGDTRGSALVTSLTAQEIEALPDDPEDLQTYLEQLAGPDGATFFLNGFRGGRLPTKEEIRSLRIRHNSFSADGHESGGRSGIEIVTRPSTESFSGNTNFAYQDDAFNARNALAVEETPEGNKQVQFQFRGPILRGKSAFTATVSGNNRYTSNNNLAVDQYGNRIGTQVRVPTDQRNANLGIEHALTKNSTLRLNYQRQASEGRNQGLGNFDLIERARETESSGNMLRAQIQGVIGKSSLNEIRFQFNRNTNATTSITQGETIIIQDASGMGSGGVNNKAQSSTFELADNFDFTPHKNHQMRVGLMLEGGTYSTFDQTNAGGRWVYATLDDYYVYHRPLQFSIRDTGALQTSFNQYQLGFYWQDEIKVNNHLSVGVGLRNEMQTHINDMWNVMPRIGFSLNPGGNKTSIRGGYGVYYDWYDSSLWDQTLRLNGQNQVEFQQSWIYPVDEFGNVTQVPVGAGAGVSNRTVNSPDLKLPYVHQASLGVQQQLFANVNLQVTYQRQEGRDQLRGIDINTPIFDPETGLMVRPDPSSGIVTEIQSTGHSISNRVTFQTRYQLPNQRGMLQVAYQLGNAKSDFSGATSLPSSSLHPELDWGPSGQDVRHQGQVGGMVRLPWDFRLQGNMQVRSAPAFNLTTGVDNNRDGVINDRPFGVSRNSLRGEGFWNITQLSLNKAFGFGGSRGTANPNATNGNNPGQGNRGNGTPNFQQGGFGGGNFQGGGGGNFQGGGRGNGGNFGNASSQRYQVQFSVRAQNPLNRTIETNYTGNMRSPYFMTATGVQQARRIELETSFRF